MDILDFLSRTLRAALVGPERVSDMQLADLALTRDDLTTLQSAPYGSRQRMLGMAAQFGLGSDQIDADRGEALDIARACAKCAETGRCRRFLAGKGSFSAENCPNYDRYKALEAAS